MDERTKKALTALKNKSSGDRTLAAERRGMRFIEGLPRGCVREMGVSFWVSHSDGEAYVRWDGRDNVWLPHSRRGSRKLADRIEGLWQSRKIAKELDRALDCILAF